MKIWITRWALSHGIEELEIDLQKDVEDGDVRYKGTFWLHAGEWHRTRREALQVAIEMIGKAYQRTLKRLDEMDKLRTKFQKEIERESASGKNGGEQPNSIL